ncbi:hypothetical protein C8A01DRAFT_20545 [Parachaetomium inaequale]|uniref:Uncharacterized protein n=1 Tax=Parachaetomium inaequale TaxID=2588326 RepID=A0AAN6PAC7_9PEZI|nr:hypothetical protein C8A01DRAFT_20545 [Parachaetomium inaequale]
MRLLSASPFHRPPLPNLERKSGWVRTLAATGRLSVSEGRIAVAVRTTCDLDLPVFSLVSLADNGGQDYRLINAKGLGKLGSADEWREAGIRPAIRSTGISAFAFRIRALWSVWAEGWKETLDCFDKQLEVQVTDILTRRTRLQLMYDDSNLAVSELYFFISQLLRFASVWIRESVDDLHDFVLQLQDQHFSPAEKTHSPHASFLPDSPEAQRAAIEVFRQNWQSVMSHQQKLADDLLDRIAKKQEEVSSLREGIFTATAVSEATKSKQLNHYILVFTVVTIFYLPLSFVAVSQLRTLLYCSPSAPGSR